MGRHASSALYVVVGAEYGQNVLSTPHKVKLDLLVPRFHGNVMDLLLADGLSLLKIELIQVYLELGVEPLPLIDLIEYLPSNVPPYLLLSFGIFFGN